MAYKQAQDRKKHLLRTYHQTRNKCCGVWFDEETGRYIKCPASNTPGYTKSLRRVSNRKVRKATEVYNFGIYKKLYDYKWILW